jgi:hypothetical protein
MFDWIKKLRIPKGLYCYQLLKIIPDEKFGFCMKVRNCSFYHHIHNMDGYCLLEDCLIEDQCKLCGRNEFTDKELEEMKYGHV